MIYKTKEELEAALTYWQKVLRLQDWNITAQFVRRSVLTEETAANISMMHCERMADISLMDPIDYPEGRMGGGQDHESDLVHELIHIHTHRLKEADSDTEHYIGEELLICQITDAIVRLKRNV